MKFRPLHPADVGDKLPRPKVGPRRAPAGRAAGPLQSSPGCALEKQSAKLLPRRGPPAGTPVPAPRRRVCASPAPGRARPPAPQGRRGLLYPSVLAAGSSAAPGGQSLRGRGASPAPPGPAGPPGDLPAARDRGTSNTHLRNPRDKETGDWRAVRRPGRRRGAGRDGRPIPGRLRTGAGRAVDARDSAALAAFSGSFRGVWTSQAYALQPSGNFWKSWRLPILGLRGSGSLRPLSSPG